MITTSSSDETGPDGAPPTLRYRRAWLVLAVGLLITVAAALYTKSVVEKIIAVELNSQCDATQTKIVERLDDYARLLQRGVAFFSHSKTITREEWHLFNQAVGELQQQLPGIQGVGFSLLIPPEELPRHVRELRSDGFPEYAVKPAGQRPLYSSIIFLEPFSGRNLRAFGYDMFSEPVRRAAMELARDTNKATLSGKVVLVQEDGVDVQTGALMYLPVYHKGLPHETVAPRRAALMGWVYSPYRMGDLMRGILSRHNDKKEHIHLQLFDGREQAPQALLYESHSGTEDKVGHFFHANRQIIANGRLWTLNFTQTGDGFFSAAYIVVWLTLAGGGVISLLLFSLVRSLLDTGARAEARARIMTRELRKSEEKISLILNTIGEAVCGIDLNGCCTFCNPAALLILGYRSQEEMLGKNLHELTHHSFPDGSPFPVENCSFFKTLTENRGYRVDDELFWRSDGSSFPVEYWSEPQLTEGRITGAVVTFIDITRRKELDAKIQDAREYAENIVETLREPLVVLDSDMKIITANQGFYATFKVAPEETIGNSIYDLGNRQWDIPALRVLFEEILPQETVFNGYEVVHDFPGIGRKMILLNAREIFRKGIGSHIILLAMEDITARKHAEALLQKQQCELQALNAHLEERVKAEVSKGMAKDLVVIRQEKLASLGTLVAGMAHEINSPLGFISCNLRILNNYFDQIVRFDRFRRDLDDSDSSSANLDAVATRRVEREIDYILEDGADLIRGTLDGARRITKIVQDLKLYARVDLREKEAIMLDHCLESALAICNSELKYVATIRKEYESLPKILCNQVQLSQVFLNLLVNAGQAIVSETPGEIVLRSWQDGLFVYVSVSDTGKGIPEEIRGRIFDPFFTTRDVGKGTGLGLSISFGIIKEHNGELLVESVVGVGTTFTVKLPRTPEESMTMHPQESS